MKIYYFNDRDTPAQVHLNFLAGHSHQLNPQRGAFFEFDAPDGAVPYVKVWENNQVYVSFMSDPEMADEPGAA